MSHYENTFVQWNMHKGSTERYGFLMRNIPRTVMTEPRRFMMEPLPTANLMIDRPVQWAEENGLSKTDAETTMLVALKKVYLTREGVCDEWKLFTASADDRFLACLFFMIRLKEQHAEQVQA